MASPRERETAKGIIAGKSTKRAMIDAGYGETYADRFSSVVLKRLEAAGLVTTDEDVRTMKAKVDKIFEDAAENVARATIRTAIDGNPVAQKEALARGVGVLPKRHEVSMDDVGAVVDDLLADAARELDPEAYERLRQTWAKRIEARKRP